MTIWYKSWPQRTKCPTFRVPSQLIVLFDEEEFEFSHKMFPMRNPELKATENKQ